MSIYELLQRQFQRQSLRNVLTWRLTETIPCILCVILKQNPLISCNINIVQRICYFKTTTHFQFIITVDDTFGFTRRLTVYDKQLLALACFTINFCKELHSREFKNCSSFMVGNYCAEMLFVVFSFTVTVIKYIYNYKPY